VSGAVEEFVKIVKSIESWFIVPSIVIVFWTQLGMQLVLACMRWFNFGHSYLSPFDSLHLEAPCWSIV
jgi:hypothetical protein